MKKCLLCIPVLFSLLTYSFGQTANSKESEMLIDSLISQQVRPNEPGVSILVAKQGKVVYEKAYGSADVELNVPLQPDMIFKIGSVTKQFTAIAILQLVEKGLVSLQDSIQKFLPDFPSKGYTITVENLLTHTSGIMDYSNADTTHNPYIEREDFTPQRIVTYFNKAPLEFIPGSKYNYSNSGYVLLGRIIENVTGERYHDYMRKNVIIPAGLTSTLYANEHAIVPKRVKGYTKDNGFYENCEYQSVSIAYAAGDLMSTVNDLYKWNNSLLAYKLVSKATLDKAFTPFKLKNGNFTRYGYGWFIDSTGGSKCIHHEGQINGFIALEKYFPKEDVYVAILTNVQSGEDKTDFSDSRFRLFETISQLALGKELGREMILADSILNNYVGTYQAILDKKQTLTIYKKNGHLYADLSNRTGRNMLLVAQSETKFLLPDVKRIQTTFEFIKENGKTIKLIATQDKQYEWQKIK